MTIRFALVVAVALIATGCSGSSIFEPVEDGDAGIDAGIDSGSPLSPGGYHDACSASAPCATAYLCIDGVCGFPALDAGAIDGGH